MADHESSAPQDPPLLRSETSDLRLTYSLEQGPPIADTLVPSVETEDIPASLDLIEEEEADKGDKEASSSAAGVSDDEEDDTVVLRPAAKRKALGPNASFYSGLSPSQPRGDYVDKMHELWYWNYDILESHHGFIQWLFPVFESSGMNMQSSALEKEEAAMMRKDIAVAFRIVRSYKLMLNFYGIRLANMETGEVERQPDYWEARFLNLRMNSHNFLRINRILASLGHLGFHRYRRPLIEFFQTEVRAPGSLIATCESSLSRFWEMALTPESRQYERKTLETAEDRVDSIFFTHLANDTPQFADFMRRLGEWEEESAEDRKIAIKRDLGHLAKWKGIMEARRSKRIQESGSKSKR